MKFSWGRVALMGIVMLQGGMLGCGSETSSAADPRKQCGQLREQLVGIQMQNVTADHEQHRAAFRAALGDRFLANCVDEMPADERDCALAAKDAAALVACHAN